MTYSNHVLDQALSMASPIYPAAHDGRLPTLAQGTHCYLLARDGLFVFGQGCGFNALIRLSTLDKETPFGTLREGVFFDTDRVPRDLIACAAMKAQADCLNEWAGAILYYEGAFNLVSVRVNEATPSTIDYSRTSYDDDALILDMHSHGTGHPYFSTKDNRSDAEGVHLSCVFGYCDRPLSDGAYVVARVTINGHFLKLSADQWMADSICEQ